MRYLLILAISALVLLQLPPAARAGYYDYGDVLLVVNQNSDTSREIGGYFMSKRPNMTHTANLTGISASESVSCDVYNQILQQLSNYFGNTTDDISYVVTTKGVPLVATGGVCNNNGGKSVDSMLAYELRNITGYRSYLYADDMFSYRKYGFRLLTRLDGYNLTDIKALIDRSGPEARKRVGLSGKFVIDHVGTDSGYYQFDISSQISSMLASRGFNVVHEEGSSYVRNETDVVGYVSWGSHDTDYKRHIDGNSPSTIEQQVANSEFTLWNGDQPQYWNVDSGSVGKNDSTKLNFSQPGITEISQNITTYMLHERRFYFDTGYGPVGFSGSVLVGMRGFDSGGNMILQLNKTVSWDGESSILKYYPDQRVSTLQVFFRVSLVSGTYLIDRFRMIEIAPTFTWKDGAIGTTYVSSSGRTFNDYTAYGQTLVADLLQTGISGAEGFVSEPYTNAVADGTLLFDRYTRGYNLAESFYMASLNMNWKDVIIGDPKTSITNELYPPKITLISPANMSFDLNIPMKVNLSTNEESDCRYDSLYSSFSSMRWSMDTPDSISHGIYISPPDGNHTYYFACNDSSGNINSTSLQFSTLFSDLTAPLISGQSPSGELASGTSQATISVTTNEAATCKYGTTDNTYDLLPSTLSTTGSTSHSQLVTGLTNGNSYAYYVRCMDAYGNKNTTSAVISFSVAAGGGEPPPEPPGGGSTPGFDAGIAAILMSSALCLALMRKTI